MRFFKHVECSKQRDHTRRKNNKVSRPPAGPSVSQQQRYFMRLVSFLCYLGFDIIDLRIMLAIKTCLFCGFGRWLVQILKGNYSLKPQDLWEKTYSDPTISLVKQRLKYWPWKQLKKLIISQCKGRFFFFTNLYKNAL